MFDIIRPYWVLLIFLIGLSTYRSLILKGSGHEVKALVLLNMFVALSGAYLISFEMLWEGFRHEEAAVKTVSLVLGSVMLLVTVLLSKVVLMLRKILKNKRG